MNQHGEGKEGVEITQEAQRSDRRRSIREIECTYLSSLLHALQSRPPPRLISRLISRAPKAHHPPAPAAAAAAEVAADDRGAGRVASGHEESGQCPGHRDRAEGVGPGHDSERGRRDQRGGRERPATAEQVRDAAAD